MAEVKSIHSSVEAAEKTLWGCMADAQALVELMNATDDESPFVTIGSGIIQRLTDAFDGYHTELLRHGVPSLDERTGEVSEAAQ